MAGSLPPPSIFDKTTWKQLGALVEGDDVSFLEDLLNKYLETATATVAVLRDGKDPTEMRRAAHTLFGSSVSLGVTTVATICRKLELELGRIPIHDMPERLAKIERQLQRVRDLYPAALNVVAQRNQRGR